MFLCGGGYVCMKREDGCVYVLHVYLSVLAYVCMDVPRWGRSPC